MVLVEHPAHIHRPAVVTHDLHRPLAELAQYFRVRAGDTVYDATAQTQLNQLYRAMMAA